MHACIHTYRCEVDYSAERVKKKIHWHNAAMQKIPLTAAVGPAAAAARIVRRRGAGRERLILGNNVHNRRDDVSPGPSAHQDGEIETHTPGCESFLVKWRL